MNKLAAFIFAAGVGAAAAPAHAQVAAADPPPVKACADGPLSDQGHTFNTSATRTIAGKKFGARVSGGITVGSDAQKLSAGVSGALTIDAFDQNLKAANVDITGNTYSGGRNTVSYSVKLFGYDVIQDENPAPTTDSYQPISAGKTVGWIFDATHDDPDYAWLNDSWDWNALVGYVTLTPKTTISFGMNGSYNVSPTNVTARMLTALTAYASIYGQLETDIGTFSGTGSLKIARLSQGGHATLKADDGKKWRVDAANTVSLTDAAGGKLVVAHDETGFKKTVFNHAPKSASDDYDALCTFTKSF